MDRQICAAIESKHHLVFNYDGLPREIEPHAHGTSSKGKEVVRGFQTDGQSLSGPLGWRLWDVVKMKSFRVSDSTFTDARPDYVRGDSHMNPLHCELSVLLMRIVHFSDLHLDSPFAWAGATGEAARQRRQALRDTLVRILDLTRKVNADALFCGGDLYEHEYFRPDTAEFLKDMFAGLAPIPVYIAPGNHDWYGPQSLYAQVDWSENVHVFREAALRGIELNNGLWLWGAAHLGPANTGNFLNGFHVERSGIHIALFHGAERTWFAEQGAGKQPHAAFDAHEIEAAGLAHAFLGHYHRPKDAEYHTYPGNPDPLAFGEDGVRGAIVATISPEGGIECERHRVAVTEVHDLELDVTGLTTQQQILNRLEAEALSLSGFARLTVRGEIASTIDIQEGDLRDRLNSFEAVQIVFGDLRPTYDMESICQEPTVRGQFVRDVLDSDLAEDEKRRVVVTGLRALDGRTDLESL